MIWLGKGPADEEWGRLKDGRWGIGTGGHVDVFARFADASTILLAQVSEAQRRRYPIMAETYRRMEKNFKILQAARDQDGRPFRILRISMPDPMTASVDYDSISPYERLFFNGAEPGERITYYLPAGYLNFIIANGVVVTARLWEKGRPLKLRETDERAKRELERAFLGRKIVQVGVTPSSMMVVASTAIHAISRLLWRRPITNLFGDLGRQTARDLNARFGRNPNDRERVVMDREQAAAVRGLAVG